MTIVKLRAKDRDTLTLLVPLDSNGMLDVSGPEPWMFVGTWDRHETFYGRLRFRSGGLVLEWAPGGEESHFNLDAAPVRQGAVFTARTSEGSFDYTVDSLQSA